jgi:hypothetical protein
MRIRKKEEKKIFGKVIEGYLRNLTCWAKTKYGIVIGS